MLTAARSIKVDGVEIAKTPAVVPSFSSKGFIDVADIVETLSETITDCALFSAYDIAHGHIKSIPTYPAYLILDSGGYETSKDSELSDTRMYNYVETPWSSAQLEQVLDKWGARQPTIAVSFDHPSQRMSVKEQVERARELFKGRKFGRELLIKPHSRDAKRIDLSEVLGSVYDYRDFDVLGFTEKELGYSIFDRMVKIAQIRTRLTEVGISIPIHIFGSLDTVSTPLYFLAGADIFDGLTWLRYSYEDGRAVYQKNAAALKYGIRINDQDIDPKIWADNYQSIVNMELAMRRYLKEKSFASFKEHASFFETSIQEVHAKLED